jgi:hypothetical protein
MVWLCCAGVATADSFESRVPRSETTGENFLSGSLLNEQRFVFTSDDDSLKEHSLWIEGGTPKCSPKRAMKVSIEWMNKSLKIVDNKDTHWECCSVRLRKADDDIWFWVVDYEYMPRVGMSSGIPHRFSVPVLADGTVPKVKMDQVRPDE